MAVQIQRGIVPTKPAAATPMKLAGSKIARRIVGHAMSGESSRAMRFSSASEIPAVLREAAENSAVSFIFFRPCSVHACGKRRIDA
jgi:hypothetical protein